MKLQITLTDGEDILSNRTYDVNADQFQLIETIMNSAKTNLTEILIAKIETKKPTEWTAEEILRREG